jgi:hypothetical protein
MRLAVVLVGLAACGPKDSRTLRQQAGDRSAAPPQAEVLVSDAGVGRITTGVQLGDDPTGRFVALMPGWTFTEERDTAEDHDVSVITGTRDGNAGLTIVLNHYFESQPIVSVSATDPSFQTDKHLAAGMTVGDAADIYPDLECRLEVYDPNADVLEVERRCFCMTPDLTQVSFAVAPSDCASDPKAPVSLIQPAVIGTKLITALDWIPTAP